ncbi:SGNH/GDSL hydrolase family protein [Streptomyces sp. NPDC058548]|uniref:SGNH/GDSL hydrolase family protein n=1 Tax=unclassified Streptomyces TaxID=2593676 RepID=UPI0036463405
MRVLRTLGLGTAVLAMILSSAAAAPAAENTRPDEPASYYLALGDSLATGYQAGVGSTNEGYTDVVHRYLKSTQPNLRLVKLGCVGETSATFVAGGRCSYEGATSQLEAARDFLRRHPGEVSYVTLNIGANDIHACVRPTGVDAACIPGAMNTVGSHLSTIVSALKEVGGAGPTYGGMGTFDPLLATWLSGPSGRQVARQSVELVDAFNAMENKIYRDAGYRVVDTDRIWLTHDFEHTVRTLEYGTVPVNVGMICSLTTMCDKGDLHPNRLGYAYMGAAFYAGISAGSPQGEAMS